jgi:peroxiredoxin
MKTIIAAVSTFLVCVPLFAADVGNLRKAPDFSFNLPEKGVQQLSQYRGKVVALEFIFTTCPHCQAASKMMTKLQEEYGPRGLQVIDVAVNQNADLLVDNFARDFKVNFPVGWDPSDRMTAFMGWDPKERFVVPQLVLIDRKGMIHYQTPSTETPDWDKLMTPEAVRAHIEELINLGGGATASAAHHKALPGLDTPAR